MRRACEAAALETANEWLLVPCIKIYPVTDDPVAIKFMSQLITSKLSTSWQNSRYDSQPDSGSYPGYGLDSWPTATKIYYYALLVGGAPLGWLTEWGGKFT